MAFGLSASVHAQSAGSSQPNIVMINIDDLGAFAAFQGRIPHAYTPNMDRLAEQGVQFTQAHSNAVVCSASRTSYLTGKTPGYSGIQTNSQYSDRTAPDNRFRTIYTQPDPDLTVFTLPEWLKDEGGYYTLGMGKVFHGWSNVIDLDLDQNTADPCARALSWSEFYDIDPFSDPQPSTGPIEGHYGNSKVVAGPIPASGEKQMMDTRQTDSAVYFINAYAANPGNFCNRPFFLALGYYRPHSPYVAPEPYFDEHWSPDFYAVPYDRPYNDPPGSFPPNGQIMPPQPVPAYADYDALDWMGQRVAIGDGMHDAAEEFHQLLSPLPGIESGLSVAERRAVLAEANRAQVVQSYLASVSYIDAQIGRVLDALEAHPGLLANTVVVLVSDHGFNLGQKKHWFKNALWDQVTRVPMLLRDPRSPGGRKVSEPVSLLDVFPTLCDVAGIEAPTMPDGSAYLDGRSLHGLLQGAPADDGRPAITVLETRAGEWFSCYPHYSVHAGAFHGIRYRLPLSPSGPCPGAFEDEWELYHLGDGPGNGASVDPYEWTNLAGDEAYAYMLDWMEAWLPGGRLEGQRVPSLSIARTGEPCIDNPSGALRLSAESNANLYPDSLALSGRKLRWVVPEINLIKDSSSIFLPLDRLPPDWVANGKEVLIYLELLDSNNAVLNLAVERVSVGPAVVDPAFSASIGSDGRSVEITPNEDRLSEWCFGDSVCWTGIQPAPHTYTAPGSYTISRRILDQPGCSPEAQQTVSTSSFAYWLSCLTPYPPLVEDRGPDALELRIPEVHAAVDYALRWRTRDHTGTGAWQELSRDDALLQTLEGLPEASNLEVQAKTFCWLSSSDWSVSVQAQTRSCNPPVALSVEAKADKASWTWLPSIDAQEGQQFLVQTASGGFFPMIAAAPQDRLAGIKGLVPDTDYNLYGRSRCPNLESRPVYNGTQYSSVSFRTVPTLVREEAASGPSPLGPSMQLWPNPAASGRAWVLLRSGQQAGSVSNASAHPSSAAAGHAGDRLSGEQHITLFDLQGKRLMDATVPLGEAMPISLQGLPAGSYVVEWQETGLRGQLLLP